MSRQNFWIENFVSDSWFCERSWISFSWKFSFLFAKIEINLAASLFLLFWDKCLKLFDPKELKMAAFSGTVSWFSQSLSFWIVFQADSNSQTLNFTSSLSLGVIVVTSNQKNMSARNKRSLVFGPLFVPFKLSKTSLSLKIEREWCNEH